MLAAGVGVWVGTGWGVVVPTGMMSCCPTRSRLFSRPFTAMIAATEVLYAKAILYKLSPTFTT